MIWECSLSMVPGFKSVQIFFQILYTCVGNLWFKVENPSPTSLNHGSSGSAVSRWCQVWEKSQHVLNFFLWGRVTHKGTKYGDASLWFEMRTLWSQWHATAPAALRESCHQAESSQNFTRKLTAGSKQKVNRRLKVYKTTSQESWQAQSSQKVHKKVVKPKTESYFSGANIMIYTL